MAVRKNLDLKILFLARDPRAILEDRIAKSSSNITPYAATQERVNSMDFVCKHTEKILSMIQNDPWLSSRSHILRFEDFVLNKNKSAAQILTHAGLRSDKKVAEYIEKLDIDPKVTNSWKENLQSRKSSENFSPRKIF